MPPCPVSSQESEPPRFPGRSNLYQDDTLEARLIRRMSRSQLTAWLVIVANARETRKSVAAASPWRDLHRKYGGLYLEHPIRPLEGRDPLESFEYAGGQATTALGGEAERLRLGYACLWEPVRDRTWSGSAWHLRQAMLPLCDTVDIGVQLPSLTRTALKAIHTRYRGGRLTTSWCYSRLTDAYVLRAFRRGISENSKQRRIDAVLMIDALAAVPEPFFVYYDSSWDAQISSADSPERYAALRLITPANMRRRREIQLSVYERATGVIAESHWLRRSLIEQSGVSPAKVHVAPPAVVAGKSEGGEARPLREREAPRRSLLCVSRIDTTLGFYRKGIDLVVDAVGVLRREYDPNITLTLAGMSRWPLPGGPPERRQRPRGLVAR